MARITWDDVGERFFETGIDRGVFYSPNHMVDISGGGEGDPIYRAGGFPWNGLVSVDENSNVTSTPIYFDGNKIIDIVNPGNFSADLKAFTYPDEFQEFDGFSEMLPGISVDNQNRNYFGLSYRSLIGNDISGKDKGYKIHILYNLIATPNTVSRETIDSNIQPFNFAWTLTSKPVKIFGKRPAAHLTIDSTKVDPTSLILIEDMLYGDTNTSYLPSISEVMEMISVTIIDLGGGVWRATGPDHLVTMLDDDIFQIDGAGVEYITGEYYYIWSSYEEREM